MLMYRWWLSSWLTVCSMLVYSTVEIKLTEMQENLAQKKTLVNATLHLISGDRFKEENAQNLKYQCITDFCVQPNI